MDLRRCGVGFVGKGMVLVRSGTFYLHLERDHFIHHSTKVKTSINIGFWCTLNLAG
jgi:hypothetical protein